MATLPANYRDFRGGLNTQDAPYLLQDNQARDLLNVQASVAGSIQKRTGLVTLASPASASTSLFASEATGTLFLIGAVGTTLVSVSAGGTVTSISTAKTASKPWEFVSAPVVSTQGPVFGMNGTDTPQQWSGSGSTANWTNASGSVAVPNGKYCVYANNQVFVSGTTANPSRVWWSAIADPTNFDSTSLTGAGFVDLDPNDGQAITALGKVGPYILAAKARKLWVIVDPSTPVVRKLSDQVGCVSHRSMQAGAEGTFFLSEDRGVYLTNGSSLNPVSDNILPTINGIFGGLQSQAAGGYFNGHYYLSIPTSTSTNDTTLDYDAKLQSWWKHGFGSNQFALWHPGGIASLYSAKATAAIVDQCFAANVYTDNGSAMSWVWRGPWQSPSFYRRALFPTPYYRKRLRQMRWDGYGTVDFSLAKDFASVETLIAQNTLAQVSTQGNWGGTGNWGAADGTDWGGTSLEQKARAYSLGVANAFSVVFSATSTTQDAVTSYLLMLTDRKDLVTA